MDDARARRRAERKRSSSTEAEIEEQDSVDAAGTRNRPKLSPIKESGSDRRRRRVVRDDDDDDSDSESPTVQDDRGEENENGQVERKRRKKSKKKKQAKKIQGSDAYLDSTLISQIRELSEDIVETEEPVSLSVAGDAKDGLSQPISKIFVEFPNGFKEMGRSSVQRDSAVSYISTSGAKEPHITTTIDIAVQCQLVTHGFLAIVHGILAGIAIASCIMIAYLHEPFHTETDFLQHYKSMAYTLEAIFFVLLSLCLLNALDRCDPGHSLSLFIQGVITFDATAILVILYSVALVLTLAVVNTEDKMGLLTFSNATLQDKIEFDYDFQAEDSASKAEPSYVIVEEVESSVIRNMEESGEMHSWWVVGICRCVLVSLAWVVFAVRPFKYSLLERVRELTEEAEVPTNLSPW